MSSRLAHMPCKHVVTSTNPCWPTHTWHTLAGLLSVTLPHPRDFKVPHIQGKRVCIVVGQALKWPLINNFTTLT